MAVAAVVHYTLSDTPYALWVRGDLAGELHLPNDGSRVEVIGGEIVVSPALVFRHNRVARDIGHAMSVATTTDPDFRWEFVQTNELNLVPVQEAGTYEPLHTWKFGETIRLPEPLGFEIDTERWKPWTE
ncbi:hypothetical protein [Actinomadura madurae]|uniref:hypothetical protein n=1 Tax=Actinomadura madurae TaxID=1993 RepID=UPI0020D25A9B|nr:hypothetical protein [Actinomadura madurae]MCP9950491.1 hypothetical protein [Actinomadura madurae]MCP9967274.1 hypothetical protein [Actinomadura madurae]MCP9979727.1 hypothetical protein [Actinomadura madurae]MCQ0008740.1 hypothetical protein [Actinomadura madurae]MCQ0015938.1 hypothetical protein [Actinomadura madurae]